MARTAATRKGSAHPHCGSASHVTEQGSRLILPLLLAPRPGGRPRTACPRRVVKAVFHRLQSGWRGLSGQGESLSAVILDSQSVKDGPDGRDAVC